MSAFLQTMLENLRPIPLMEVMANMIVWFPSMLVFSRFGITSWFNFPTSLGVIVWFPSRQGAPSARGRRWCTHPAAGASSPGAGTGAGSLDFLLDGARAGTLTSLVEAAAGGVAATEASTGGEAGGREALGAGVGVNLVDLGGAAEESGGGSYGRWKL
jgi:hypothetical protein